MARALFALFLLSSCDEGRYAVVVHVPGGAERAARVEVSLLRSCSDVELLGDDPPAPLRVVEAVGGRPSAALGPVAEGQYALYARAWERGCQLFAVACQAFRVEGGGRGTVDVIATEVQPRGCEPDERCQLDECVPWEAGIDAGAGEDGGAPADASIPTDAAAADAAVPAECPDSYVLIDGSRYRPHLLPGSWLSAEQDCEDDAVGAHLMVVDTVDEHFLLHALTVGVPDVWIGYTDRREEGAFRWVAPGGLNPFDQTCFWDPAGLVNDLSADCVVQLTDNACGDWFVVGCGGLHAYVCECDDRPADHEAY